MGLLDAILGRSKPVPPDLDQLFALPSAALTLQAGAGFSPTGRGSVCFAERGGRRIRPHQAGRRELLDWMAEEDPAQGEATGGAAPVRFSQDSYGYTWLLAQRAAG